jgi:hypothetical protein
VILIAGFFWYFRNDRCCSFYTIIKVIGKEFFPENMIIRLLTKTYNFDLMILNSITFINSNIDLRISRLALKKNPFPDMEWISILNQIEAKSKS